MPNFIENTADLGNLNVVAVKTMSSFRYSQKSGNQVTRAQTREDQDDWIWNGGTGFSRDS